MEQAKSFGKNPQIKKYMLPTDAAIDELANVVGHLVSKELDIFLVRF